MKSAHMTKTGLWLLISILVYLKYGSCQYTCNTVFGTWLALKRVQSPLQHQGCLGLAVVTNYNASVTVRLPGVIVHCRIVSFVILLPYPTPSMWYPQCRQNQLLYDDLEWAPHSVGFNSYVNPPSYNLCTKALDMVYTFFYHDMIV